jgi:hypothetical protein
MNTSPDIGLGSVDRVSLWSAKKPRTIKTNVRGLVPVAVAVVISEASAFASTSETG